MQLSVYKNRQVVPPVFHCTIRIRQEKQMSDKFNIKATKGFWTPERDKKLIEMVKNYGGKLSWNQLARAFPGVRGKYIRERYRNHLDPQLKIFGWTWDQDQILKKCFLKFGNRWELISRYLPGRSANQVKNRVKRREFKELFPQPHNRKKAWDPTVYPSQIEARNPKRSTILAEEKQLAKQQEQNHRLLRQEIKQEMDKEIIEEPPLPPALKQTKTYISQKLTKTKKMELASLHLQRTYELIKQNLIKRQPSDFYLIFQTKTKREIFTKIKSIQWTITQLWPLVTNRSNRQCHGQEIAFFLYCLIKADNQLANKILHRLMKCDDEDYLMRKVEKMIDDIDEFIRVQLQIVKQKELLQKYNCPAEPKGELLESINTNDTFPKQELDEQKQKEHMQPDGEDKNKKTTSKINVKLQEKEVQFVFENYEAPKDTIPNQLLPQYDFDFAMLGKLATIRNQITAKKNDKNVKLEENTTRIPQTKMQVQEFHKTNSQQEYQHESQNLRQKITQNIVELSSTSHVFQENSRAESVTSSCQELSQALSQSCSQLNPQPECVQFRKLNFMVCLTVEEQQPARTPYYPFYEFQRLSDASSMVGSNDMSGSLCRSQMTSNGDSNQILMRVKHEHIEGNKQACLASPVVPFQSFQSILRNRIMSKLKEGKCKQNETIIIN